jgi:hypothetical protein
MISLIWLASLAFADCPPQAEEVVWRATEDVQTAYVTLDERGFDLAANAIAELIPCMTRPIDPPSAARLHRTMGLIAFVSGQVHASRKSWAASRLLDPDWHLPERDYPDGHPLRDVFESSVIDGEPRHETLNAATWLVDGMEGSEAPLDRAFILQALDEEGAVAWTGYLWSIVDVPMSLAADPGVTGVELRMGLLPMVGASWVRQDAGAPLSPMVDVAAWTVTGGGRIDARWLPDLKFGGELAGTALANTDPVMGGGYTLDGTARFLVGVAPRVGRTGRLRVAARPGFAMDQTSMWGFAASEPQRLGIPSIALGAEVAYLRDPFVVRFGTDVRLAEAHLPYYLGAELSGGWMFGRFLALEATVTGTERWLRLVDDHGDEAAVRRNTDVRGGVGIAVWR